MNTILVTGGAGFIGSHVCCALLERGDSVICVDNLDNYYSVELKKDNLAGLQSHKNNSNFRFYKEDIRDFDALKRIFGCNRIDKVIHLAAKAGVRNSILNPKEYYDVNINGTLNLLELVKEHKIRNFVFASSSSVYGNREKGPFSEKDTVDFPVSPYAATKKAGEELCYTFHHLYSLPITCLRFFTVYGPAGRPDMAVFKFTKLMIEGKEIEMYGDGESERDYTHVSEIVKGVLAAVDNPFGFEIINLGNNQPVKLKYLISVIENALNKKAKIKQMPMQKGDVSVTYADISKAKKLLGYKPDVSIEEGIKNFVEWYKKHFNKNL